jgi:hypothetical protein
MRVRPSISRTAAAVRVARRAPAQNPLLERNRWMASGGGHVGPGRRRVRGGRFRGPTPARQRASARPALHEALLPDALSYFRTMSVWALSTRSPLPETSHTVTRHFIGRYLSRGASGAPGIGISTVPFGSIAHSEGT